MCAQGGDGIVLLDARAGYDRIVTQDRNTPDVGNWIDIVDPGTRQIDGYGFRR